MPDFAIGNAHWPDFDVSLLDNGRGAVPAFPIDLMPQPWRDWLADAARTAGAPVDYVVQALFAAVAGVCGTAAQVRVTPDWTEPLVLWQALVGTSSSSKSPAIARIKRVMGTLEAEQRASAGPSDGESLRILVANPSLAALARAVAANPRGVLLWRDRPSPWLGDLGRRGEDDRAHWLEAWSAGSVTVENRGDPPVAIDKFAVSVLGTLQPEHLSEALSAGDDGLAARFLYAWPDPAPYCPLRERRRSKADESVRLLRLIAEQARRPDEPLVLAFDEQALDSFDVFLAGLETKLHEAEGLEAAWLGKGGGAVARLAAVLELLTWSCGPATAEPGPIGRATVAAAIALWTDYFRPHAHVVFQRGGPSDTQRRVRQVIRWLRAGERREVSREDIRREALVRTVNASQTDGLLAYMSAVGIVRPVRSEISPAGGRPASRWQINPAVFAA
jgi:uncharacterized protein DUF3987